ncbi:MAG: tetratricopeptide repeat protein [Abditibacteriales bacterium]|nr:tetratricopeptide repeat protein [Abditibacteriales bacterium]
MVALTVFIPVRRWWSEATATRRREMARVRLREGSALAGAGKMSQALAKWQEAAALNPDSAEPHVLRGNYFWSQRQFRRAAEEFAAAHRRQPDDVTILFALIQNLLDAGNLSQIEPLARRAVQLAPDHPKAHAYWGIFLARTAHRQDALAEAERALQRSHELSPRMPIPLIELGKLYSRQGRWQKAQATLHQAWQLLHQGERTVQYLESAAEVENRRAETAYALGLVYRSLRDRSQMDKWFERFRQCNRRVIKRGDLQLRLARHPHDVEALLDLAEMNWQVPSYREAADLVRRALLLHPHHPRGRALAQRLAAVR